MLKKRIIPCLDIKDGSTVKGVNFINLQEAGNPVELAKKYADEGADELVLLDITASIEKRNTMLEVIRNVAREINIPFTVGGGIYSIETAREAIQAGADKVSINSAAVKNPQLIAEMAREFGSQCVVLAIDASWENDRWLVYINGGRVPTSIDVLAWAKQAEKLGAGEILLTSMNHDGTKNGFSLDLTQKMCEQLNIPVIASGGAGNEIHFADLFTKTQASAGLAASIFHFGEISIPYLKNYLKTFNIPIR